MTRSGVFLGGYDLEMLAIAELLTGRADVSLHDHHLAWGAKASAYRDLIREALARDERVVLVELVDDLPADWPRHQLVFVDHHGPLAGRDVPTSLEQIFRLFECPAGQWTRELTLIAANDRGHIAGMVAAGGTADEIRHIRQRDRAAQGITPAEEAAGRDAAARAEQHLGGRLTVVRLPHARTATVTDALDAGLGGPGYQNLLVLCPEQTIFFGSGRGVMALHRRFQDSWFGGELPERGYWGVALPIPDADVIPLLESTLMTKPAAEIPVKVFHHTLLWPLLMRTGKELKPAAEESIQSFVEAFTAGGWHEQVGPENGLHPDYTYPEVVYFHPFVRDFLFGDGRTTHEKRSLRRFKRTDVTGVTIDIKPKSDSDEGRFQVALRVERAELFLIRPRVAMLMIEISNRDPAAADPGPPALSSPRTPVTLAQVLHLQSRLRHIYPPYFDGPAHGDCPAAVTWAGLPSPGDLTTTSPAAEFEAFTRVGAEPPVYAHWRGFFGTIRPLRSASDRNSSGLFLQQLLDDRMPALSFIAVDQPGEIHPDDADRPPAFDPPGLDYDPEFRKSHRDGFEYTRFRHWGTTYYCNGTSFVAVCPTGTFTDILLGHFRRHYTHLAIIAQFQHAALLYFADELADTTNDLAGRKTADEYADPRWRTRIRILQQRFLKFRTRSYFTEVSNQIQGKDLFRLWLRHLGSEALFDRVANTNTEVYQALEDYEVKELSESQEWLARAAAWLLPVSITFSFLSVLFASDFVPKYLGLCDTSDCVWNWNNVWKAPHFLAVLTGVMTVVAVLLGFRLAKRRKKD